MRTSQIVFGERQHLLRVLDSLERSAITRNRLDSERRVLEELIHARTLELNSINPTWDQKIGVVLSAEVKPDTLEELARRAPRSDYYLLRLISEHPKTPARTLGQLARLPYDVRVANAISQMANVHRAGIEAADIETRLSQLEGRMKNDVS